MTKILMVYTSMSGNTEEMAKHIAKGIREAGGSLTVKEILEAEITDFETYDGILLGTYTWGNGDIPDEWMDFYEEMDRLNLQGKKGAVFGSCSSAYPEYGAAVDLLLHKLTQLGVTVTLDGFKVDLAPTEAEKKECQTFGKTFVENL